MRNWSGKRYWLVGASEGLGAALARILAEAGAEVILSARSADRLQDLADRLSGAVSTLPMDVTDSGSVTAAVAEAGEIDGLVHLAAVYWPMKATEWDAERAVAMADVNFTGLVRVMGAVVPAMVARGRGHVVIVGSLAGFRGLPGAEVQLANPGFIRTRLTDRNDFAMPFLMEPEDAAQALFAHMNTHRFQRSFPTLFSWVFRLARFLPDALYRRLFA